MPGIAYGILVDGRLVHDGAAGYRDLGDEGPGRCRHGVPHRVDDQELHGAVASCGCVTTGKLSLDDPAERYVPELAGLALSDQPTRRASPSGTCCRTPKDFPKTTRGATGSSRPPTTRWREMMTQGIPFSTAPGTAYEYSNFGFAILGRIVANVSGMPYAQYRRRRTSSSRSA